MNFKVFLSFSLSSGNSANLLSISAVSPLLGGVIHPDFSFSFFHKGFITNH